MAKKFSNKQIAMAWIAGKLKDQYINPDKNEFDAINGQSISPKQSDLIKEEVRKILTKLAPRYQEYCKKQEIPMWTQELEDEYNKKQYGEDDAA